MFFFVRYVFSSLNLRWISKERVQATSILHTVQPWCDQPREEKLRRGRQLMKSSSRRGLNIVIPDLVEVSSMQGKEPDPICTFFHFDQEMKVV